MRNTLLIFPVLLLFLLSGCAVRTYKVTKDRLDQDLSGGNRGFIAGTPPPVEGERKLTRQVQTVEIELFSFLKPKGKTKVQAVAVEEKQGPVEEPVGQKPQERSQKVTVTEALEYKVQEGDTLQKIAKKFYGSTKKWTVIYEANKPVLKGPDKIYPGQVIDIPAQNLK